MEEKKSVKSIFMRINTKRHDPKAQSRKTPIFIMEIPSGKLYEGLLADSVVRGLKLRDTISKEIEDRKPAAPGEVFDPEHFDTDPANYFAKIALSMFS